MEQLQRWQHDVRQPYVDRQTRIINWWSGQIVAPVYTIGFRVWRGQTPGRMALRVRVVGLDGRSIGVGRAIVRYIG